MAHAKPRLPDRRRTLRTLAAAGASVLLRPPAALAQPRPLLARPIPSVTRDACTNVMRSFVEAGGRMIDSAPMYGSSQDTIGYGLRKVGLTGRVFSADTVWISSARRAATKSSARAGR